MVCSSSQHQTQFISSRIFIQVVCKLNYASCAPSVALQAVIPLKGYQNFVGRFDHGSCHTNGELPMGYSSWTLGARMFVCGDSCAFTVAQSQNDCCGFQRSLISLLPKGGGDVGCQISGYDAICHPQGDVLDGTCI